MKKHKTKFLQVIFIVQDVNLNVQDKFQELKNLLKEFFIDIQWSSNQIKVFSVSKDFYFINCKWGEPYFFIFNFVKNGKALNLKADKQNFIKQIHQKEGIFDKVFYFLREFNDQSFFYIDKNKKHDKSYNILLKN